MSSYPRSTISKICLNCGKPFFPPARPYRFKAARFCSYSCAARAGAKVARGKYLPRENDNPMGEQLGLWPRHQFGTDPDPGDGFVTRLPGPESTLTRGESHDVGLANETIEYSPLR